MDEYGPYGTALPRMLSGEGSNNGNHLDNNTTLHTHIMAAPGVCNSRDIPDPIDVGAEKINYISVPYAGMMEAHAANLSHYYSTLYRPGIDTLSHMHRPVLDSRQGLENRRTSQELNVPIPYRVIDGQYTSNNASQSVPEDKLMTFVQNVRNNTKAEAVISNATDEITDVESECLVSNNKESLKRCHSPTECLSKEKIHNSNEPDMGPKDCSEDGTIVDPCENETETDIKIERNSKLSDLFSKSDTSNQGDLNSLNLPVTNEQSGKCIEVAVIGLEKMFVCGGCGKTFETICKLHIHLESHESDGSYHYNQRTRTAFPKFDSICNGTQTDEIPNTREIKAALKAQKRNSKGLHKSRKRHKIKTYDGNETDGKGENVIKTELENSESFTWKVKSVFSETELQTNGTDSYKRDEDEVKSEGVKADTNEDNSDKDQCDIDPLNEDTDEYVPDNEPVKKKKKKIAHKTSNSLNRTNKAAKVLKIRIKNKSAKIKHIKTTKNGVNPVDNKTDRRKEVEKKSTSELAITCKICNEVFARNVNLRRHIRSVHKMIAYVCSTCSEQFSSEIDLKEHRKTKHPGVIYQCELCDKILSTKGMLEGHYLVHKGIKPFSCDVCVPTRTFTRKCQLIAHKQTHSAEKHLQCEFCGKPFNARYLMINHVKHCAGIKPHQCDFCEMAFVSNHCLQRHRRTHTGEKPFVCEVCAFASGNASCLARHLRTHTGERPFSCKFCNMTFAAPGALKKHERIHTLEKPYACRYCSKAFTQNWNLKTHERQHTGEAPYKCHVCGVGYKQNVLLKTHMKSHYDVGAQFGSYDQGGQSVIQPSSTSLHQLPQQQQQQQQPLPRQQQHQLPQQPQMKHDQQLQNHHQQQNQQQQQQQQHHMLAAVDTMMHNIYT